MPTTNMHIPSALTKRHRCDSKCTTCVVEYNTRAEYVRSRAQSESTRIARMDSFRSVKRVEASKDQSQLVSILLDYEARDLTRSMLEMMTEPTDDLFGRILYHDTLLQLEVSYACQYESAKRRGYKKQFATFIQSRQSVRDGSTLDHTKTIQSKFSFAQKGSKGIKLELAPNELNASWNDPDEDTDYIELFDTFRDARWDEEHEKRAERWKFRNGI